MKKRIISLLLTLLMVANLAACGSSESAPANEKNVESAQLEIPQATKEAIPAVTEAPVVLKESGALGSYDVQIGNCETIKDYNGNPAVLVEFTFTNNSEENASAVIALYYIAFQNGIQLDSAIVMDSSVYNGNDLMKEIQPGASLTVKAPFVLISETAPVEFEIAESFAFTDEKLGKTFEIAEGGITELSIAPNADTAETVGDHSVSIVSYELNEDYDGKPAIVVNMGYTNNSNKTTSFVSSLTYKAFQDGVQLETAIVMDSDAGQSQMRNIRPGAGTAVSAAYLLTSDTSPVQIEIEEFFGFSGDKITAEINIAE